jgi:hypothetical protein
MIQKNKTRKLKKNQNKGGDGNELEKMETS